MGLEYFNQFTEIELIQQLRLPVTNYDLLETLILNDNAVTLKYFYFRLNLAKGNKDKLSHLLNALFKDKNYYHFAFTHHKYDLLPILDNLVFLSITSHIDLLDNHTSEFEMKYYDRYTDEEVISFLIEDEKGDDLNLFERIILAGSAPRITYFTKRFSFPRPISSEQQLILKRLWHGKDYVAFGDTHVPEEFEIRQKLWILKKRVYARVIQTQNGTFEISDAVFINYSFTVIKEEYDKYPPDQFVLLLLQRTSIKNTLFARMIMKDSKTLLEYVFRRLTHPGIKKETQKKLITQLLESDDYFDFAFKKKKYRVLKTVANFNHAIKKPSPFLNKINWALVPKIVNSPKTIKSILGVTADFIRNHKVKECKLQFTNLSLDEILSNLTTPLKTSNIFEYMILKSHELVEFFYDKFTKNIDHNEKVLHLTRLCQDRDYIDFAIRSRRHASLPILISMYELIGKASPRLEEARAIVNRDSRQEQDLPISNPAILHSFQNDTDKTAFGFNQILDNRADELFPELQERYRLDCFK